MSKSRTADEPAVGPWSFVMWQSRMWKSPPALVRGWKVSERTSGSADARLEKGLGNKIFMTFLW